jgi:Tol biopolymer transport system component
MGPMTRSRRRLALTLGGLACVACSAELAAPTFGTIVVTVATTGDGGDADGFRVTVDGAHQATLAPASDGVSLSVSPGPHSLRLDGVAPNCRLNGDALQEATVEAGDTVAVAYEVACTLTSASVQVTTRTSGSDIDPSGYQVLIDGVRRADVDPNGSVTVVTTASIHEVALGAVTPNCEVAGQGSRHIVLADGASARVDFELACDAALPGGHGRELVFVRDTSDPDTEDSRPELYLMNDDGTGVRQLLPDFEGLEHEPDWAPDGDRLVFSGLEFEGEFDLYIYALSQAAPSRLSMPEVVDAAEPRWSPDGARIAFTSENPFLTDWYVVSEVMTLTLGGTDPDRVVEEADVDGLPDSPTWSPDGSRLALVSTPVVFDEFGDFSDLGLSSIYVVGADGADPQVLVPATDSAVAPAWSPDGSSLVYSSYGDLYIVPVVAGGSPRQLTSGRGVDDDPAWSVDGTRVAFASNRDGNWEIYVVDTDGENLTRLTNDPAQDTRPAWRP